MVRRINDRHGTVRQVWLVPALPGVARMDGHGRWGTSWTAWPGARGVCGKAGGEWRAMVGSGEWGGVRQAGHGMKWYLWQQAANKVRQAWWYEARRAMDC